MISHGLQIRLLLMFATFCAVAKIDAAALFPAAPGDWFGDTIFRGLGRTTNGLVRVAGYRNAPGGFFELNGTSMTFTPLTSPVGGTTFGITISRDGAYFTGIQGNYLGAVWSATAPGNPIPLGGLPGRPFAEGHGVANTSNGPVVVGWASQYGEVNRGFQWTLTGGICVPIGPPGGNEIYLEDISEDGQRIVGFASLPLTAYAAVLYDGGSWRTLDAGSLTGNHDIDLSNNAQTLSRDGSVAAGYARLRPAFWSGTNFDLHVITLNGTNLPLSWADGIATDGGWVAGGSAGRGWIASVTDGKAQYVEDWIYNHYGLVVTQSVTSVYDLLVDQGELFMVLANNSGGMIFSGAAPAPPAAPPTLLIARLPSGEIELRWPTNGSCAVESTPLLPGLDWTALSNAVPVLVNTQYSLTLPATNVATYFRLRCP